MKKLKEITKAILTTAIPVAIVANVIIYSVLAQDKPKTELTTEEQNSVLRLQLTVRTNETEIAKLQSDFMQMQARYQAMMTTLQKNQTALTTAMGDIGKKHGCTVQEDTTCVATPPPPKPPAAITPDKPNK